MESIGTKLRTVVSPVISDFFLSEASSDAYPYAVYSADITPYRTKDGVYKWVGEVTIDFYSDNFDEIDTICQSAVSAIASQMTSGDYYAKETGRSKSCSGGVWDIAVKYRITQFNQ